jgi:hypothetical protein
MVATESGQVRSGRLREALSRVAVAVGAKALWTVLVKVLGHYGVDL